MNETEAMDSDLPQGAALRREAELRLASPTAGPLEGMAETDVRAVLHELQVHQIELEMQNEELQRAQTEAREASEKYYELFDFAPIGYFVWDREGRILEVNLAGAGLLGLNRKAAVQQRFGQFVAAEDRPAFAAFCKRVLVSDTQQNCEIKLLRDGQLVDVLVEGIAAPDHWGQGKRCCAAVIDISQQRRADALAAANQTLQAEIAARKRAEEALLEAKTAAEAANAAKSRFLANMSHELRTPMNAVMGMLDVALPKAVDPMVHDCLQTALGAADLLLTLLNDLLDSAKIESGKLELESAPFSPRRMLEQITRVLSMRASEKGLCLSCHIPDETPHAVLGDRMRLQQVLVNLVGNAIKFTDRGDIEISLSVKGLGMSDRPDLRDWGLEEDKRSATSDSPHPTPNPQSPAPSPQSPAPSPQSLAPNPQSPAPSPQSPVPSLTLEFAVRDTGIGIPPSVQEHLFQPFAQADTSIARRFGGTGLGLSICKSLVEIMGGRIWVESEAGKGSTFYFTIRLPLAKDVPADFQAPVAVPKAPCVPLRILLVEDNPANQKLAAYILQDRGHTVEIAGNGHEAIHLTGQNRYDVVLMDVQMPVMDGLEAVAAIRKREVEKGSGIGDWGLEEDKQSPTAGTAHLTPDPQSSIPSRRTPIIAMTAHARKDDREQCLAAGMDAYLSKPIKREELVEAVERLGGSGDWKFQISNPKSEISDLNSQMKNPIPSPQSPVPSPHSRAFNLDLALGRLGGEMGLFREMAGFFFSDGMKLMAEIRAAATAGDASAIERKAHRLKGTVLYLGAQAASEAVARVEAVGRSGDLTEAARAIRSMETKLRRLAEALRPYRGEEAAKG